MFSPSYALDVFGAPSIPGPFPVLNGLVHPNTGFCFHFLPSAKPVGAHPSALQLPETVVDIFIFCHLLFSLSLWVSVALDLHCYFRGVFGGSEAEINVYI